MLNGDSSRYTKRVISDLLQNKIDMSQLVITKALSKTGQSLSLWVYDMGS